MAKWIPDMSKWTPLEREYSLWLRAAREKEGTAASLGRALVTYLRKTYGLDRDTDVRVLGVKVQLSGRTLNRWEKGVAEKPQPQGPGDWWSREALVAVVTELVPVAPVGTSGISFRDAYEAFLAERLERQERGAEVLDSHAALERNEERHQFLATWPSPAGAIDPIDLKLGSWAFKGALSPYVSRTADNELAVRMKETGVTTVSGAPKAGKSRSVLEVLQCYHPDAMTWWVNPSPTVLPMVVENAKKAKGRERPIFIVLDDAGLIGTDPTSGLTAQRLSDLTAACTSVIVIIHDETLAGWNQQLTNRTPADSDSRDVGATSKLMDLLSRRRVRYDSVLNDEESISAKDVYSHADERVEKLDKTRIAETLAGVEMLRDQALKLKETPASVHAALLEAAIDSSIAYPTGADPTVLAALAAVHYRRRQPNRPWRQHSLDDAFDALTTGITAESPHAILITSDHQNYRLLDALVPELQGFGHDILDTLKNANIEERALVGGLYRAVDWYYTNGQTIRAQETLSEIVRTTGPEVMFIHNLISSEHGDFTAAEEWLKKGAESGEIESMSALASHAKAVGNLEVAREWWTRAADKGHLEAMIQLAKLAYEAKDMQVATLWGERIAASGDEVTVTSVWWTGPAGKSPLMALTEIVEMAYQAKDLQAVRRWGEHIAASGDTESTARLACAAYEAKDLLAAHLWAAPLETSKDAEALFLLGVYAEEADLLARRRWWQRAGNCGHPEAMYWLGEFAQDEGEQDAARRWWKLAADSGYTHAYHSLAALDDSLGNTDASRLWWKRAAAEGDRFAMYNLGWLDHKSGNLDGARHWWECAAELGHLHAMTALGGLERAAGNLGAERGWWERAAERGHRDAMCNIGHLSYQAGDVETARKWWEKGARKKDRLAMYNLGNLEYDSGNLDASRFWWERAAKKGERSAMLELGYLAEEEGSHEDARIWWERAAKKQDPEAMYSLGCLAHEAGKLEDARVWWERAAKQEQPMAMHNLGCSAHEAGQLEEARVWWERAAKKGEGESIKALIELAEDHDVLALGAGTSVPG